MYDEYSAKSETILEELVGKIEPFERSSSRISDAKKLSQLLMAVRVAVASTQTIQQELLKPLAETEFEEMGAWLGDEQKLTLKQRKETNAEILALLSKPKSQLTPDELEKVKRYSGFGGTRATDEAGIQYDYYTIPYVAKAQAQLANMLKPFSQGDRILEPSCGTGVFFDVLPDGMEMTGVELDPRSSAVADTVNGSRADIHTKSFEQFNLESQTEFDCVLGNAPFGDRDKILQTKDDPEEGNLDRYFLKRSLQKLKSGGILVLQVSDGLFRGKRHKDFRLDLLFYGQFMGALRLPNTSYEHAGSKFASPDILIFKRHEDPFKRALMSVLYYDENLVTNPSKRLPAEDKVNLLTAMGLYNELWHLGSEKYYKLRKRHMLGEEREIPSRGITTDGQLTRDLLDAKVRGFIFESYEPNPEAITPEIADKVDQMEKKLQKTFGDSEPLNEDEIQQFVNRVYRQGTTKHEAGTIYVLDVDRASMQPRWKKVSGGRTLRDKILWAQNLASLTETLRTAMYDGGGGVRELQNSILKSLDEYEVRYHIPLFMDSELQKVLRQFPYLQGLNEAMTLQIEVANNVKGKPAKFSGILTADVEAMDMEAAYDGQLPEVAFLRKHRAKFVFGMTEQQVVAMGGKDLLKDLFESESVFPRVMDGMDEPMFVLKEDWMNGRVSELEEELFNGVMMSPDENWRGKFEKSMELFGKEKPYTDASKIDMFISSDYVSDENIQTYLDEIFNTTDKYRFRETTQWDGRNNLKAEVFKIFQPKAVDNLNSGEFVNEESPNFYVNFTRDDEILIPAVRMMVRDHSKRDYPAGFNDEDRRQKEEKAIQKKKDYDSPDRYQRDFEIYDLMEIEKKYGVTEGAIKPEYRIVLDLVRIKAEEQLGGRVLFLDELIDLMRVRKVPKNFKGFIDPRSHTLKWGDDKSQTYKKVKKPFEHNDFKNGWKLEAMNMTRMLNGVSVRGMGKGKRGEQTRARFYNRFSERFRSYVMARPDMRDDIVKTYNEQNNGYITSSGADYPIEIQGWNSNLQLYSVQWESIHHALRNQRGISSLGVGFGKTLGGVALTGILLQEKRARRFWVQVPNNKVPDWARAYNKGIPHLKATWITSEIAPDQNTRFRMYNEMANSTAEVVIFPESMAVEVQLGTAADDEATERILADQMRNVVFGAAASRNSFKQDVINRLNTKRGANMHIAPIVWESFQCDAILVDELHNYKNLFEGYGVDSDVSQVSGIKASRRGVVLLKKYEYLRQKNGIDKSNCFGLTATPMSNSPLEYWNMQYLINPSALRENNIGDLGSFVRNFCVLEQAERISKDGQGTEFGEVLKGFRNIPQLRKSFLDTVYYNASRADLEKDTKSGKRKEGKRSEAGREVEFTDEIVGMGQEQAEQIMDVRTRMDELRRNPSLGAPDDDGKIDPKYNKAIMWHELLTTSIDAELSDPEAYPNAYNPKLMKCVENVRMHYEKTGAGQLIFCDRNRPAKAANNPNGMTYHDKIYRALTDKDTGVFKPNEVLIVNGITKNARGKEEEATDGYIEDAVRRYNAGEIKCLIGNTPCMGEGLNLQANSIAVHHLDIPFRPSDLVQRNGRVDRQGNEQLKTYVYNYSSKGTLDPYLYSVIGMKREFIDQILDTETVIMENPDNLTMGTSSLEIELALAEAANDEDAVKYLRREVQMHKQNMERGNNIEEAQTHFQSLSVALTDLMRTEVGTRAYEDALAQVHRLRGMLNDNPEWRNTELTTGEIEPFVLAGGNTSNVKEVSLEAAPVAVKIGDLYIDTSFDGVGKDFIDKESNLDLLLSTSLWQVSGFAPSSQKINLEAVGRFAPKRKLEDPDKPLRAYMYYARKTDGSYYNKTPHVIKAPSIVKSLSDLEKYVKMPFDELRKETFQRQRELLYLKKIFYHTAGKEKGSAERLRMMEIAHEKSLRTEMEKETYTGASGFALASAKIAKGICFESYVNLTHKYGARYLAWEKRLSPFIVTFAHHWHIFDPYTSLPNIPNEERNQKTEMSRADTHGNKTLNVPQVGDPFGLSSTSEAEEALLGVIQKVKGKRLFYLDLSSSHMGGAEKEIFSYFANEANTRWQDAYLSYCIELIETFDYKNLSNPVTSAEDSDKARMRRSLYILLSKCDSDTGKMLINRFDEHFEYEIS
jgi:hypothetical protein